MRGENDPQRVLLGVCGAIGAALIPSWVVWMRQRLELDVRVVLTRQAEGLVSPRALGILSGAPALIDESTRTDVEVSHLEAAAWADAMLIAPATANAIARLANGHADDLLTTIALATSAPLLIVPSLPPQMAAKPSVIRNLRQLRNGDVEVAPTALGWAAADQADAPGAMLDAPTALAALLRFVRARRTSDRETS